MKLWKKVFFNAKIIDRIPEKPYFKAFPGINSVTTYSRKRGILCISYYWTGSDPGNWSKHFNAVQGQGINAVKPQPPYPLKYSDKQKTEYVW